MQILILLLLPLLATATPPPIKIYAEKTDLQPGDTIWLSDMGTLSAAARKNYEYMWSVDAENDCATLQSTRLNARATLLTVDEFAISPKVSVHLKIKDRTTGEMAESTQALNVDTTEKRELPAISTPTQSVATPGKNLGEDVTEPEDLRMTSKGASDSVETVDTGFGEDFPGTEGSAISTAKDTWVTDTEEDRLGTNQNTSATSNSSQFVTSELLGKADSMVSAVFYE